MENEQTSDKKVEDATKKELDAVVAIIGYNGTTDKKVGVLTVAAASGLKKSIIA